MKYFITNFANLRYLTENQIPISTCCYDPAFFHSETNKGKLNEGYFINKNNVMHGLREEALSPKYLPADAHVCSKNCPYRDVNPNCPFILAYANYLDTVDFTELQAGFITAAEDIRKITKFTGEPEIVLLVYEAESNPCSERQALVNYFSKHGINFIEFKH